MEVLIQFLLRLSFGLAFTMSLTSARRVTSGYFRNNFYVLFGGSVIAALACGTSLSPSRVPLALPILCAVAAYLGSAIWLYERPLAGKGALVVTALLFLATAVWLQLSREPFQSAPSVRALDVAVELADVVTSGALLGGVVAAMLLGHWFLNSPGMPIASLKFLNRVVVAAVLLRMIVPGLGIWRLMSQESPWQTTNTVFLATRWMAGLLGTAALTIMSQRTLDVPNTQSATGILYVAVITAFLGELAALPLSREFGFPL